MRKIVRRILNFLITKMRKIRVLNKNQTKKIEQNASENFEQNASGKIEKNENNNNKILLTCLNNLIE